ncbi:MAG: ribosome silencing factor [Kofleriaceae bacterium]
MTTRTPRKPTASKAPKATASSSHHAPRSPVRAASAKAAAPTAAPAPEVDDGLARVQAALALALDKKALEPVLLDVRALCSYCNYQLVLSGRSERQVEAIADGVRAGLRDGDLDLRPLGSEGARNGQWSLLDYGDFVVHVFAHAAREHYDLEGLWSDAPRVPIEVPADARIGADDAY